ncbi:unnamed protein product, partial [Soboliphyme baturini]|uniref:Calx-beta domain-containing protein n=1 Tax=Soboliphyme baturini TaxID=241478 RepID=A0A183IER2_9BILA
MTIVAICVAAVPDGEKRRIKETSVFFTTAAWSVFAYLWLIFILLGASPNRIDIWESLFTLLFYPALVVSAYLVSLNVAIKFRSLSKYRGKKQPVGAALKKRPESDDEANEKEKLKESEKLHNLKKDIMRLNPHLNMDQVATLVAQKMDDEKQHNSLWYRMNAVRGMSASTRKVIPTAPAGPAKASFRSSLGNLAFASFLNNLHADGNDRHIESQSLTLKHQPISGADDGVRIEFDTSLYVINPNVYRRAYLKVVRRGNDQKEVLFRIRTVNGTAQRNVHFLDKKDFLFMKAGETVKQVDVELQNPEKWKSMMAFWVKIEVDSDMLKKNVDVGRCHSTKLLYPIQVEKESTVEFTLTHISAMESDEFVRAVVVQTRVDWITEDGTALHDRDFIGTRGCLIFEEGAMEKYVDIALVNDFDVEKDETFTLKLTATDRGKIGTCNKVNVTILNDDQLNRQFAEFEEVVRRKLHQLKSYTHSWKDQFVNAASVNGGDVEEATMADCITHIISFPWKVLCALVPPPCLLDGWLTFVISFILICIVTALIGEMATVFGCLVGIKESVTAITIVVIGTKLPDMFASRAAAIHEKTADGAIGHITGSVSVTVFLGLGLPWFISSIYWACLKQPFIVHTDHLGFRVLTYTVLSLFCIAVLVARRYMKIFGNAELGGPVIAKWLSAIFLFLLWLVYVFMSAF